MLFKELCVPENKVNEFAQQIQQHENGIVGREALEQDDWFSEIYQQAMMRFTE